MASEVEEYLRGKGIPVRPGASGQIHVPCWECGEDPAKRGRLYVDTRDSNAPWTCFLCGAKGNFITMRKHFGDPIPNQTDLPDRKLELLETATAYLVECMTEEAYLYLRNERGFSAELIDEHRFGWDDGTLGKFLHDLGYTDKELKDSGLVNTRGDFLQGHITIPYIASGRVVQIRGKKIGGKYVTPPNNPARVFNTDSIHGQDMVILTEGEMDCITIEGMGYAAIGVPGANVWQDKWDAYLSDVKRIYICFDSDDAGRAGAEKLATRFSGKARVLSLPLEGPSDVNDWYMAGNDRDDFDILLNRSRGGLLLTVDDAYEEWLEVDGNPDITGVKIGFDIIDAAITPGITPGQVAVILAATNAGKSVTCANIVDRMNVKYPDKKVLMLSLEQTRGEWFEKARRIHKFYDPFATEQETMARYRDNFLIVDKNRVTGEELEATLDQYEYEMGQQPDLVIVDYLGYWARGFRGEAYERITSAIFSLKAIAKERRIAMIAPHQVSRAADIGEEISLNASRDGGTVEETADYVIALWNPDQKVGTQATHRTGKVYMKIQKSRRGGVGTQATLQFAPATLALVAEGGQDYRRAKAEHQWVTAKDTFAQVVARHQSGDLDIGGGGSYNMGR